MNKFILLWFGLVITLIYPSCKCCKDPGNPDCKNYDPCYGKEATSADFICYAAPLASYSDRFKETLVETDSVYTSGAVFQPKQNCDSIKWKIGDELDYRTSKFCYVNFGGKPSERIGTIPVTCIIYRRPNTSCFPADDGIDTVTRQIHILSMVNAPVLGTYRGKFITEDYFKDSFNVTVRYDSNFGSFEFIILDSLDRDLPRSRSTAGFYTKNNIEFGWGYFTEFKESKLIVHIDSVLRSAYYRGITGDESRKRRTWVGYKL